MYYYLPFFAPRDDFLGASSKTQPKWGGPTGQPSEVSREAAFAACRYVGQVGRGTLWVRRIVNPPAGSGHNAGESPERFALAAMWGSQSWLQPPFRRLPRPPERASFRRKRRSRRHRISL